ncbi:MAG: carbohydrate binding family 9 domain-containing protein [Proteobacteria bacterium]|nr:carbohydrate binding family 9 domain-containing protein [Pseudomonadota bacterium]
MHGTERTILPLAGLAALWALLGFAAAAPAQISVRDSAVVDVVRIDTPPIIDGRLDDPAWRGEPQIDQLRMAHPSEGREPSYPTQVWLRADDRALYIGVRSFDDPGRITAKQLTQDAEMLADDRINILLDPFHDQRNAYFFQINPLGTKGESLSGSDFHNFRPEWDTIWYGDAQIDDQGWTAEFMIPFRSLPLDPEADTWGFEFERCMPALGERDRWANWSPNKMVVNPQNIGAIRGLRSADGRGTDVRPVFSTRYARSRDSGDTDRIGRPGLDVFFRPTSSVTAALTLNTDFSDAPVDDRRSNLTRFATFFPETRDFFLRDAGIFDFAGLAENGRPFFSRRIGLVDGRIVNLDAGVKATGRVGDFEFGAMQVRMAAESGVRSPADLSVARLKLNVLESSQVGLMFTRGDPRGEIDNHVAGADFRYRNARFQGDKQLRANLWFQRSQSSGVHGREAAFGAQIEYPNDRVNARLGYTEIQENFDPRLGFVNRRGFRQYSGALRYRIRPGWINRIDVGVTGDVFTDRENRLESGEVFLNLLEIANAPEDLVKLMYFRLVDRPQEDFLAHPDALVPAGEYDYEGFQLILETSASRPLKLRLELANGTYYSGRLTKTAARVEFRPLPQLFASLYYEQYGARLRRQIVELEGAPTELPGDFTLRLVRARVDLRFTPEIAWTNTLQYDNLSDSIGLHSRLRWEITPGREFYLVFDQNYRVDIRSVVPASTQLSAKLGWTFRY